MATQPIDRDAWRDLIREQAMEPERPIIDAHHHVWPEPPVPHMEAYGPDALAADKVNCGHNIVATIFAEAYTRYRTEGPGRLKPVGETEYIDALGRTADAKGGKHAGLCAGIVAYADMMLGAEVGEVLDAHLAASRRVRGIRFLIGNDVDFPLPLPSRPHMMADAAFRAAFAQLKSRHLSFDVWLMHPQLPELADLAAAFPDTQIILDHVGSPMGVGRYASGAGNGFEEWHAGMRKVAALPNVALKLGGLNMEFTALGAPLLDAKPWSSERMAQVQRRHILTAIDLFGAQRCMFETNFPPDRMSTGATALWNCFKRITSDFSAADKHMLFFETARKIYRLQDSVPAVQA